MERLIPLTEELVALDNGARRSPIIIGISHGCGQRCFCENTIYITSGSGFRQIEYLIPCNRHCRRRMSRKQVYASYFTGCIGRSQSMDGIIIDVDLNRIGH